MPKKIMVKTKKGMKSIYEIYQDKQLKSETRVAYETALERIREKKWDPIRAMVTPPDKKRGSITQCQKHKWKKKYNLKDI